MDDSCANEFKLHPTLAADSLPVVSMPVSDLLLIDDSRYPWCVLVPRVPGAVELHDLSKALRLQVWTEIEVLSQTLKELTGARKMNVAALGNVVEQLHVHVIGRRTDDAAWPAPVWGTGPAEPYASEKADALVIELRNRLG